MCTDVWCNCVKQVEVGSRGGSSGEMCGEFPGNSQEKICDVVWFL